mmetsp:Transcript_960/g.2013  ORF Transcript_960/g.2013 Transcript_960/m.2013 type:complete len:111 (-) Transcript_960:411-743(-)
MADDKAHQGIQKLLQAEHSAMEVVAAAKAEKHARLKQAKEEAESEIAAYKAEREAQFNVFSKDRMGDSGAYSAGINAATEKELAEIAKKVSQNQNAVIDVLLKSVSNVNA